MKEYKEAILETWKTLPSRQEKLRLHSTLDFYSKTKAKLER
jgi:hypothetical protein